jgi:hypothetical protein
MSKPNPTLVFVSHNRALCSVCGAPVGREVVVSARVVLLRVILVYLGLHSQLGRSV